MAGDLLARLKKSPVLCDGAMGTLLYAKGIFINRCYDELNVSQPDLIRGLHHEYLQAGAEIIETNTFGGNSFRLARHGMENRVREINLAGARLGREAAKSFDVWVAGSVGPAGNPECAKTTRASCVLSIRCWSTKRRSGFSENMPTAIEYMGLIPTITNFDLTGSLSYLNVMSSG